MSRAQLMQFLKATKGDHGVRNLSLLSKPELQGLAQSLLDHPTGGNFFSDFWSGIKKGAEIVSKPLSILEKVPGIGPAVFSPIHTVTDLIKGSGQKKKVRIKIKNKGALKPFGYEKVQSLTIGQRHKALDKAVASGTMTPTQIWHRLNALMVFNKKNPKLYKIFRADRDYVKEMYMIGRGGCMGEECQHCGYVFGEKIKGGCGYCPGCGEWTH